MGVGGKGIKAPLYHDCFLMSTKLFASATFDRLGE